MICKFERIIQPAKLTMVNPSSYMVAIYRPCEKIKDSAGKTVDNIKAVGYGLPTDYGPSYDLKGRWYRDDKYGMQFTVEGYEEIVAPNRRSIIAYLSSGKIKGVGPVIAQRIYDAFGKKTLEILDEDPEKLLTISGISAKKLEKIRDSYLENRGARDLIALLVPHGITANRAIQIYRAYGAEAVGLVKRHPYHLCNVAGIGFTMADRIAMSMGFQKLSPERVDEGLLYTLQEAEGKGHLCMEKRKFIQAALAVLDTEGLTEEMAKNRAAKLVHEGRLCCYKDSVYRWITGKTEESLAELIFCHSKQPVSLKIRDIDQELNLEEKKLGIEFNPEQRLAVELALKSSMLVITGGPGTGKTSIQRAVLDIYQKQYPGNQVVCCASSGRAARRMEQAVNYPASTIHKALRMYADDNGNYGEPEPLDADLVLVDEFSMVDAYLARDILRSIADKCQLVLIGDADQLPSVGPGAVLSEIIKSGVIPVVRLEHVYRQNADNKIPVNAQRIRHGNTNLEYGEDFQFLESKNLAQSAELIEECYLREVARYGMEHVALLSPFRQKTETGVNALNARIRDKINPPGPGIKEGIYGNCTYRTGDKIMQTRNHSDINNGDVGYITDISGTGSDMVVKIDFRDGRLAEYEDKMIAMLDLGYASTVHKAQGSEYQSVIINLQCAHYIMLVRPLIYTAITRAKERVIIIGEKRALCMAIKKQDTEKRGTMLAERLRELSRWKGEYYGNYAEEV